MMVASVDHRDLDRVRIIAAPAGGDLKVLSIDRPHRRPEDDHNHLKSPF